MSFWKFYSFITLASVTDRLEALEQRLVPLGGQKETEGLEIDGAKKSSTQRAGLCGVRSQAINGNHSHDHRRMAHSRRLCRRA